MEQGWTVSEVARMAHVTVRTLHHYDELGLLRPRTRSRAGYRLYDRRDLERLQQILLHRELGFSLRAIAGLLDGPTPDLPAALRAQRTEIEKRKSRLERIIGSIDRTLASLEGGDDMNAGEMFEGFEPLRDAPEDIRAQHQRHAAEVHERWGDTGEYAESMRRAQRYSKREWATLRQLGEKQEARMASLLEAGVDPTGTEAMETAEAMRQHISQWFYPCSREMHVRLADMYEADERFAAHYDGRAPGLAAFVARAIRANAQRG